MAKQVSLSAHPRTGGGKGEARALRRDGRVPAVAYGAKLAATPLSVDGRELYHVLHTDAGLNAIIRLDVEGETHLTIARDIQRHPVRRVITHVDFVAFDRDKPIEVEVPIHLEGHPAGVDEGGVAEQTLYSLPVSVLPLRVPDSIIHDISGLGIGDVLRVSDLAIPEGVEPLEDPDRTVVTVSVPQLEVPEPEEGEAELLEGVEVPEVGEEEAAEAEAEAEADESGDED